MKRIKLVAFTVVSTAIILAAALASAADFQWSP